MTLRLAAQPQHPCLARYLAPPPGDAQILCTFDAPKPAPCVAPRPDTPPPSDQALLTRALTPPPTTLHGLSVTLLRPAHAPPTPPARRRRPIAAAAPTPLSQLRPGFPPRLYPTPPRRCASLTAPAPQQLAAPRIQHHVPLLPARPPLPLLPLPPARTPGTAPFAPSTAPPPFPHPNSRQIFHDCLPG